MLWTQTYIENPHISPFKLQINHFIFLIQEYRRKGYSQLIVRILSKRLVEQGKEVYGCITDENEPSKKMFTALGFTFTALSTWINSSPKQIES
jgi:predicted GNAT family acetyltransferase